MQTMGLSAADLKLWAERLTVSHGQSVDLRVMDTSGKLLASIAPVMNTGQINLDTSADVTRTATLTFNDPNASLQFDSDSPNTSALYFDRMVQVRHVMKVPALNNKEVATAIITGALVKYDRTDVEVTLELQGKESFALNGCETLTIKRGANAVNAIRTILKERVGETQFAFPSHTARLPKTLHVSWDEDVWPWKVCKKIASSLGLHLYYDGTGTCRLRDLPTHWAHTFHTGEGGNITSKVQMSHDLTTIRNRVHVVGSSAKHAAALSLDNTSPLSPRRLAINGVPRYFTEEIQSSSIRSDAAARKRAKAALLKYDRMDFGTTFNALPTPHLDELDMFHVDTAEYVGTERLRQFSLALTGGDMTVGFNDLVSLPAIKAKP